VAKTEPEKKPEPEKRPKPEEETEPSPKTVSKGGPAKAATGEWPQWRGPNRDGVSHETGLLKKWPAEGPPKLWTAKGMGQGYASVAVANGLVYTAGNVGGETKIAAVDLDGNVRWQSGCGRAFAGQYAGSRGTPTIDGNKLYYETPNGEVSCLDARTGQKVWSVDIMQRFRGQNIGWALSESVLIDGNNVICSPGGPNAGVVALNKANGETVWACKELSDKPGYASPIVFDLQGVHQIVTMNSVAAVGIHAKTGKLLWRHEHRTNYDANIPTPIFYKGTVFIDSGYGKGGALLKLNPGDARQVWTTDLDNHHGGIVLVDEHLYGSSQNGKWMCVELRTGRTAYADGGVGKGSVTCADGMLYMLSEQGTMGLAPATPNGHTVVSRFRVPAGGSGEVWAHPVVCGGRLYIRHGDALHAFDIKAR
jgi:outer membrane protein assembly factor BamB